MAASPDATPPLLPVIPEYTPWLDKVRDETARDAAATDATFAARHGEQSVPPPGAPGSVSGHGAPGLPEEPKGAVTDATA